MPENNTVSTVQTEVNQQEVFLKSGSPYKMDLSSINFDEEFHRVVAANGLHKESQEELYHRFNRMQTLDPTRRLNGYKEYLFFTKPNLLIYNTTNGNGLYSHVANDPLFQYASVHYPNVLRQLQYNSEAAGYPFMNLLSNTVKNNLDLPEIKASQDIETAANIYGTKITYRNTSYSQDDQYEFNLDFEDSKYLEVYMLFKIYDEYERKKQYGNIAPDTSYVIRKIIHDQFSIYKFIVDEDGTSLVFWAKLTGVYPKGVPREAFADLPSEGGLKYSVPFKATFVEEMKPELLTDFNKVTEAFFGNGRTKIPIWDKDLQAVNPDWPICPRIKEAVANDASIHPVQRPKLEWYS